MRPRPLDKGDRDAYLHEIRPRLLMLRCDAGRLDLRWLVPSWALEEPLRLLLRVAALTNVVAPDRARSLAAAVRLPLGPSSTTQPPRTSHTSASAASTFRAPASHAPASHTPTSHAATSHAPTSPGPTSPAATSLAPARRTGPVRWWPAVDAFFSEADRDQLALPDGVPLVDVRAADARVVVAEVRP